MCRFLDGDAYDVQPFLAALAPLSSAPNVALASREAGSPVR